MVNVATIVGTLKLIDQYSPVMAKAAAATQQAGAQVEGALAKARAASDQAIAKMADGWNNAKASVQDFATKHADSFKAVGQAAALVTGALLAAAGAVIAFGIRGSTIAGVQSSFHALAKSVGETGDAILNVTRAATKGLISDLSIMQVANKGILLGLPITADEMGVLGKTAISLGRAMKLGPEQAMNDLVTALGRSSPLILDNLGLTVKMGEANETYARKLGKSVEQLTDAERKIAFYNAAMTVARAKVEELGDVQLTFGDRVQQGRVLMANFTDALSVGIATSPVLAVALDGIAASLQGAFGQDQAKTIQRIIGWINRAAIQVISFAQVGVEMARFVANAWYGLNAIFSGVASMAARHVASLAAQLGTVSEIGKHLPGSLGVAFAMINLKAKELLATSATFSTSFQNDFDENLNRAGNFNAAVDRVKATLGALRGKMIEASNQEVSLTAITDALAAAAAQAGAQANRLGNEVGQTGDKAKAAAAKIRDMSAELRKLISFDAHTATANIPGVQMLQAPAARVLDFHTSARANLPIVSDPSKWMRPGAPSVGLGARGIFDGFGQVFQQMPQTIMAALQGGGNVAKSLGGSIGSFFGSSSSLIGKTISSGLSKALGGSIGGALGSIVPGLGTLLGSVAGSGIGKLFGGLFGGGEKKEAQGMASSFVEQMGGLQQLQKLAKDAGVSIDALMSAKKTNVAEAEIKKITAALQKQQEETERLNRAIDKYGLSWKDAGADARAARIGDIAKDLIADHELLVRKGYDASKVIAGMSGSLNAFFNDAMTTGTAIPAAMKPMLESLIKAGKLTEENARLLLGLPASGVPAFADVQAAAERYGISIDSLGPKVKQLEINASAQQIVADFELMVAAGGDVGAILDGMKGKAQGYVDSALQGFIEIPGAMKPMLEQMVAAGLLTDANGEKLKDLSGIKFAEPLAEAVDRLLAKLDELINTLSGSVEKAFTDVTRDRVFRWKGQVEVDGNEVDDESGGPGPHGFALGTGGVYRDFGMESGVRLHGRQRIMTEAEGKREQAHGGEGMRELASELRALRRDLPRAVGVAVQDAAVLAPRRRIA